MVKGRNEPCAIGLVAWVVSKLHGVSVEEVGEKAWGNTVGLFGLDEGESMLVPGEKKEAPKEFDAAKEEWPTL